MVVIRNGLGWLLFAVVTTTTVVVSQEDDPCAGCWEYANTFMNCVDEYCTGLEGDQCFDNFYGAQDLGKCCGMPKGGACKKAGKKAQKCYDNCLDECVKDTAGAYISCTFNNGGSDGCDRSDCFQRLALDREYLDDVDSNEDKTEDNDYLKEPTDFFDNFQNYMEQISDRDAASCTGARTKADEVCHTGDRCCMTCNPDLSDMMSCVVNTVYRPFLAKTKTGIDLSEDCDMRCDNAATDRSVNRGNGRRHLAETTTTTTVAPVTVVTQVSSPALPKENNNTTNNSTEEAIVLVVDDEDDYDYSDTIEQFGPGTDALEPNSKEFILQKCQNRLTGLLATGNETRGVSDYLSCSLGGTYANMPQGEEFGAKKDDEKTSSAATTAVAAAAASVVSFLVLLCSSTIVAASF